MQKLQLIVNGITHVIPNTEEEADQVLEPIFQAIEQKQIEVVELVMSHYCGDPNCNCVDKTPDFHQLVELNWKDVTKSKYLEQVLYLARYAARTVAINPKGR